MAGMSRPKLNKFSRVFCILGDPGTVSRGREKSERARKKFGRKKSQEREEEPLGTRF